MKKYNVKVFVLNLVMSIASYYIAMSQESLLFAYIIGAACVLLFQVNREVFGE